MPSHEMIKRIVSARLKPGFGRAATLAFAVLTVVGGVTFALGAMGDHPQRAWQAYLINFVFWGGLAIGAAFFSAVLNMSEGRWGRSLKRLSESHAAFLPLLVPLFGVLYLGRDYLFPWIHESLPKKSDWLNTESMFMRDSMALVALAVVSGVLAYQSIRRDLKAMKTGRIVGTTEESPAGNHGQMVTSVVFGLLFAFLLSMLAVDLVMSLSPHWYSTLFGAFYFIGSFYSGLAFLYILGVIASEYMGLKDFIGTSQFHDLGKLILGFCLMTGDFFYAQFLVIWYGNLPEETEYVIHRAYTHPWNTLAWAVLVVAYILPFVLLLSRRLKQKPIPMVILCLVILGGMWLEKYILIVPALWKEESIPFGWMEIAVTLGFWGLLGLCVLEFLKRCPLLPVSDPLFHEQLKGKESG